MKKKIRRRIFSDTYPPHVETYRKFAYPSPPKKFRRLLWTAPKAEMKKYFRLFFGSNEDILKLTDRQDVNNL